MSELVDDLPGGFGLVTFGQSQATCLLPLLAKRTDCYLQYHIKLRGHTREVSVFFSLCMKVN